MSHKIDERKDNIRKIKKTIENTQDNMEFANDILDSSSNIEHIKIEAQNERRLESINNLQEELKEHLIGKEKKNK